MSDNLPADTPPETLFHYTTSAGAIGIVQERVIWATSIANLNDALDGEHYRNLAIESVRARSAAEDINRLKLPQYMNNPQGRVEHSYRLMLEVLSQKQVVDAAKHDNDKWPPLTCVTSFTTRGDLLSQWRAYSGGGIGFQLGFNPTRLGRKSENTVRQARADAAKKDGRDFDPNEPVSPSYLAHFNWYKCRYSQEEQRDLNETAIDQVLRNVDSSDFYLDTMLSATRKFATLAAICKNESFREEDEWRIVMHDPRSVYFRTGIGGVVPFAKIRLDDDYIDFDKNALVSIRVGPGHNQLLAAKSIQQCMLRSQDPTNRAIRPLYFAPELSSCSLRT